jgi:hypothetical protein
LVVNQQMGVFLRKVDVARSWGLAVPGYLNLPSEVGSKPTYEAGKEADADVLDTEDGSREVPRKLGENLL